MQILIRTLLERETGAEKINSQKNGYQGFARSAIDCCVLLT